MPRHAIKQMCPSPDEKQVKAVLIVSEFPEGHQASLAGTVNPAFGGRPSIWHETFLPLSTPHPLPSCAGVERRLRAFAPRNRDGVRGRPPLWPAGDPVAQSVACVRPVVSPPVRRPDVRGCSPLSVADRTFRRDGRHSFGIGRSKGKRRKPFHGRGRAAKGRSCGFLAAQRRKQPLICCSRHCG